MAKKQRATINFKKDDATCFQYAITVELNHEVTQKEYQRLSILLINTIGKK